MTRVVDCKIEEYDVFIGKNSKWENPYKIGNDGTKKDVFDKYLEYIKKRYDLLCSIGELRNQVLGCYSDECHGELLSELANCFGVNHI